MNVANNIAALESYGLSVEKTFQNPANLTCEEEKALSLYDELKALEPEVFNDNASRIMHFTLNAPPLFLHLRHAILFGYSYQSPWLRRQMCGTRGHISCFF